MAVASDWHCIAKAFPFLKLRCQLFDREHCEDDPKPLVEYLVENGDVVVQLPTTPMTVRDMDCIGFLSGSNGCTIETFREAVEYVRKRMANRGGAPVEPG